MEKGASTSLEAGNNNNMNAVPSSRVWKRYCCVCHNVITTTEKIQNCHSIKIKKKPS